ncbi:DNA polymerase III subunit gamma/tau [Afifella sp. IM 167]|uniref:DNA polymerase III subunit gamma/tau n=1 Tax=Afifella sp. IM 167 TaxID=2033586 RepID=UPI001CCD5C81|nr:DNA polymerase III subunit gamma/tau [Afifella sp. IM 167]MBZ8133812.1 DNA polymerase III subunit gamma/tau [Afifella sp. IM 167]
MSAAPGYQVLARKYRPSGFDDLIGQEAMVRTLKNAFRAGRIPHAWMLTGVRGIGKTTTARILARGLNYATESGDGGPTVEFTEEGIHCRAIMEGRHPDVMEMDAASHTGIDDIRDIIDSARYSPTSARYKVYIIDEVHMLSKAAFNGLLKTLEEPPPHVKFIFATTEIRKVPVTVLSRCQRFDLKRIEAAELISHLHGIAEKEGFEVEAEALRMVARAAEGSVRDALSILDQAVAHGAGKVEATTIHDMLGLADRARIVDLFEKVMAGDTAGALGELAVQHEAGADPITVLTDLAEFTHYVTLAKLAPEAGAGAAVSETERVRAEALSGTLSISVLSRAWQILLKGIQEAQLAGHPEQAADMVIVRLCHAAQLPTPEEALRALSDEQDRQGAPSPDAGGGHSAPAPRAEMRRGGGPQAERAAEPAAYAAPAARARASAEAAPRLESFADIVAEARARRDIVLVSALERHVRPVKIEEGRLEVALDEEAAPDLAQRLSAALSKWTGQRWVVILSSAPAGQKTVREEKQAHQAKLLAEAQADPMVREVLERFPGAEIVAVREAAPDDEEAGDEEAGTNTDNFDSSDEDE